MAARTGGLLLSAFDLHEGALAATFFEFPAGWTAGTSCCHHRVVEKLNLREGGIIFSERPGLVNAEPGYLTTGRTRRTITSCDLSRSPRGCHMDGTDQDPCFQNVEIYSGPPILVHSLSESCKMPTCNGLSYAPTAGAPMMVDISGCYFQK